MNWVGSRSYSIYLWHWPIVVGLSYFNLDQAVFIIIGIVFTLVLGHFSYIFLESQKGLLKNFHLSKFHLTSIYILILTASLVITNLSGLPSRVPDNVVLSENSSQDKPEFYDYCFEETLKGNEIGYCVFHDISNDYYYDREIKNNVEVIVIGDSHAAVLVQSVLKSAQKSLVTGDIIFYGHPACLPIESLKINNKPNYTKTCNLLAANLFSLLDKHPRAKVVLANRLS
jgi:energy-coupling factor transporter transmembrane protein EcfT